VRGVRTLAAAMIPRPGDHGGDGERLARALGIEPEAVLDLSASLNPFAPDVTALVKQYAEVVTRYPDVARATEAFATALGAPPERILLTNGGAEAIALVAALRPVGRVDEPDFSLYARHLREVRADAPRWRSNPHNPSGRLAPASETAAVWDEAFYPLATGTWTRGDGPFIVGSCTKVYACPGLRIGYVRAPDAQTAAELRALQPQWSLNAIACAALPDLLAMTDLRAWSSAIARAREELVDVLQQRGLEPEPSDTNFVLVRDARGLREHLAPHAVLVRDTASFGIAGGVRIAVPDERGLQRLADALEGYR
jgi:histidinol-phosphate/aromatic aminotransferase/cobyric acid decarboxylase-like protein